MYFKDKNNTNIDDDFNNDNSISRIINFIKKYKIVLIGLLILFIIFFFVLIFISNKNIVVDNAINYLLLNGDEVITIYEDSDYIEPGFNAYNSKNEDLTSSVNISSNLDTKNIGEYEISYTLGDIVKTRKVIVVEKPKTYTFIRLNTIDNNVNIYLKLGEEYDEPGYQVFSSSGDDLSSMVEITGSVDITKKGNYTLIYSVVDASGVTVSTSRTVTVMDTEISLSLSTSEYTNSDVTINVRVDDEFFNYMLLPDNSKITMNTYSYKVSKNGTYTFKTYSTKGMEKDASIVVKNIDKVGPTGSCIVDHDKNGSFITINVTDESGIKKYDYNGKSYTNNKIVLNEYIESASVEVYDKTGNVSKFNCKVLELSDEFLVDTSHYSDLKGLNYIKIGKVDLTNIGCNVTTGNGKVREYMYFHEAITNDLNGILTNVCKYINKSSWINELQSAGSYVGANGEDYHSKGLAVDFNNQWTYTVNGKTYRPYPYQGYSTWQAYNEFVCEVCDGKEDCEYNVNYIIFKRYFEGNGWCWGGNWGMEHFDPMHFEIRADNKCAIGRTQQISCE